jgi:hypothetical protein
VEKEATRAIEMGEATPPPLKKVAIVGFSQHKVEAPYNDPTFEIWGLNDLHESIPRWNRWFEMHSDKQIKDYCSRKQGVPYLEGLSKLNVPVYMQKQRPEVPTSVEYPIERMKAQFGDYFTNSISYMLAMAIDEGYQVIHVYGVDMAQDCLAPEMRVLTADLLWVPVGDLKVGDELLAFDEEPPVRNGQPEAAQFRKYRRSRVESLSRLMRPCKRLTMGDGTTLVASIGHKWLAQTSNVRKWVRTDALQPWTTSKVHTSRIVKLMEPWKPAMSRDAGYLAAAFDGEGCISQGERTNCNSSHMSLGYSQKQNAMSAAVETMLADKGYGFYRGGDYDCFKYNISGGRPQMLRFLGEMRPPRLLANFNPDRVGSLNCKDNVPLGDADYIGEQEVVGITTSTQTLIVEGFASHNSEYASQRPSCEFFLGIAVGRGIKIHLPKTSDLLKVRWMYGYEDEIQSSWDARVNEIYGGITGRLTQAQQQERQAHEAVLQYLGAQDAIRTLKRIQVS